MKNLNVFSFNQHWFHLGSMVENVLDREGSFEEIRINLFQQNLRTLPVDMHFRFPLSHFFKNSPEKIALMYLKSKRSITSQFISLEKNLVPPIEVPKNIEELKTFRIDNLEIGMAVASHLISLTKESQPQISSNLHQIKSCIQFYYDAKTWFYQQNYTPETDEVWVCNGRTFHERIIVELAKERNIKVCFYEIGGEGQVPNRWILHDVSPHDRTRHQSAVMRHSALAEPNEEDIEKWFLAHEDPNQNQFASKNIDFRKMVEISRKPFIVFFSSSDDEVAAISSEWNSPWGNQLSAAKGAMEVFAEQSKYHLVIRVHPNQGNKSKSDKKAWDGLSAKENSFIFGYSDSVNSYELMRSSAAVLTHGSTMGVEAAYRRKHQAYLSPTRFDQLIPALLLTDKVSLKHWLENLDASRNIPDVREFNGSVIWANYMLTAGSNWENVSLSKKSGRVVGFLGSKSLRPRTSFVGITRLYVSMYRELVENRLDSFKWN
jgi:hypothetical protein